MKRREFIGKISRAAAASACLGVGASVSCSKEEAAGPRGDRPNIILLVADNLGWKDLGCFGNDDISTPNIDRLAAEGVRFTNAFITAPSCSPSRASSGTAAANSDQPTTRASADGPGGPPRQYAGAPFQPPPDRALQ